MKIGFKVGILGLAIVGMASAASAAPLGLKKTDPDILSEFISIQYSATSRVLSVSGDTSTLTLGNGNSMFVNEGSFTVNVQINGAGEATGGVLTITGEPDSYAGFTSTGTLLTGSLIPVGGFGFVNGSNDVFEFIFSVTGGDAASIWQPKIGVILNMGENLSGFNDTFSNNFGSVSLNGISDSFAVPEPVSITLLGITGLAVINRRRVNH